MEKTDNNRSGIEVTASPFNAVKLELAIIIILGLVFWVALDFITGDEITQIGLLFGFGVFAAAWLVLRTRYLARRIADK